MDLKIAYIGAGTDINPQPYWKKFKFILVDSCPATEFPSDYRREFSRPHFEEFLRYQSVNIEPLRSRSCCDPKHIQMYQPHFCHLKNGNVFFASSEFPCRMTSELAKSLKCCDKLYISGYFPPTSILEYLSDKNPISFYLVKGSAYGLENSEGTIMEYLWNQKKVSIVVVSDESIIKVWNMCDAYKLLV